MALIGSPGVGGTARTVADLHLDASRVFVGSASKDLITTLPERLAKTRPKRCLVLPGSKRIETGGAFTGLAPEPMVDPESSRTPTVGHEHVNDPLYALRRPGS